MNTPAATFPGARAQAGMGGLLIVLFAGLAWRAPCESCQVCTPIRPETARLQLDPNTATVAELQALPEIGPTLAAAIVSFRDSAARHPAFRSVADLDAVPRIGPATIEKLRPYLAVGADTSSSTETNPIWKRSDVDMSERESH